MDFRSTWWTVLKEHALDQGQGRSHHGEVLTRLPVAQLVEVADGRGRHIDDAHVDRYIHVLDALPPLVVFQIPEGLPLADGYHRLAAAVRAGRDVPPVDLRHSTRTDAVQFAVEQAARDRGVTNKQAHAATDRWS